MKLHHYHITYTSRKTEYIPEYPQGEHIETAFTAEDALTQFKTNHPKLELSIKRIVPIPDGTPIVIQVDGKS